MTRHKRGGKPLMTEHPFRLVKYDKSAGRKRARHPLGKLDSSRFSKYLTVSHPAPEALPALIALAKSSIPGLTDVDSVRAVLDNNPDCIWAISRNRKNVSGPAAAEGFVAMLFLNNVGLYQLATNTLDTRNPDLEVLAGPEERPAALYIWAIYAPGVLAGAVPLVLESLNTPRLEGVDLFTRPNTQDGVRFKRNPRFEKRVRRSVRSMYRVFMYSPEVRTLCTILTKAMRISAN